MAMQAGMGFSKILLLIGAGYTGTIVLRNGRLSEILDELQSMLKGLEKSSRESGAGADAADALSMQVRRLAMEVRQLASARPITVLNGSSQPGNMTSLLVPAAAVGAVGYGYMWWKGLAFSDLMYVTKNSMANAVSSMTKQLDQVSAALAATKRHLTQRIENLDGKLDEQKVLSTEIKNEVTDVRGKIANIGFELESLRGLVWGLNGKMTSLEDKQNFACAGVMYLCEFAADKDKKMSGFLKMAQPSSNEVYDMSKDPKRKAKSSDPGWKYGFWPDLNNKDLIQCNLCNKQMHAGVRRLKQHLAGSYGDVQKCPKTTTAIMKEMQDYIRKSARKTIVPLDDEDVEEVEPHDSSTGASNTVPSSGTSSKRKKAGAFQFTIPTSKPTNSVPFMVRKTPEEVIEERHSRGLYQTTIENSTKSEEEKDRVRMHIANFFYENGISFNAANSRSYEIMVESIGQFGPGLKPPTFHDLRVPLLEKAKKETDKLRERHENAWKQYGCSLMSDGWSDRRGRHLINFLANSPEGTFFIGTVDASSKVQDAYMLADLFEEQIKVIGIQNVVQIVTDNGANFKAAGGILMRRFPTLYWTPCAAHCLDLMLEDIGKLKEFRPSITHGRGVTTFVYRHGRLLSSMREKTNGRDLVRSGTTRFATAFLTLQSLYKNRDALRQLFGGEDWYQSRLSTTTAGGKVHDVVLSTRFWNNVEDCIRSSQPLLVALRIVDGDEKPAMAEITAAMDFAKSKIKNALEKKPRLLKKVLNIIERRWESQMEVDLYGAALFLNPGKFFEIKENDVAYSSRLRMKFNDVLEKMVLDTNLVEKISDQADQYENSRNAFGKQLTIRQRSTKNPLDWWGAFGGLTIDLTMFAKRILGLCCSSSGCERNWSTFEFIHTKKRNRLEHQRLNDLVYIQYNRKITTRFQKRREDGKNFDPLILEEFQWDNEWVNGGVVDPDDEALWQSVDRALGASEGMENRHNPRRRSICSSSQAGEEVDDEDEVEEIEEDTIIFNDDEDINDDDYGQKPPTPTREDDDHEMHQDDLELDDNI